MLLEYLKNNYKENEPIFISDIDLDVSYTNLRQMFKVLCDKKLIYRYDNGVYYLKGKSKLKGANPFSPDKVAKCKYINKDNTIIGYSSGYTFANQLGFLIQVPYTTEIVTNNASAKYREVMIKNQKFVLRKPKAKITNENASVLQLLDFISGFERYIDIDKKAAEKRLYAYVKKLNIKKKEIDRYIELYPDKVYKNIYEMRLYEVFT